MEFWTTTSVTVLSLAAGTLSLALGVPAPATAAVRGRTPNIVVIITDDQVKGTLDAMPHVRKLILSKGVKMQHGIVSTSLCCPSRTSLLSGLYSRTTRIYKNVGARGGWQTFHDSGGERRTFAVALNRAGYKTALFGKYLNGYALAPRHNLPPGWDKFRAIWNPSGDQRLAANAYYDYFLRGTGHRRWYGSSPHDYSTDVLTRRAVHFITDHTSPRKPFLLYYATTGAHAPFTPAPRHIGTWHREELNRSATMLTANRARFWPDKLTDYRQEQQDLKRQHEALRSVDQGVAAIIRALGRRQHNTLFIYLSDNGLQFGEHGLSDKNVPFSGSTEVPMLLRWDGVLPAGTTYGRPFSVADLGATVLDVAGSSFTTVGGTSYFAAHRPRGVLVEAMPSGTHPAYCGWRTRRYLYVKYSAKAGRELFDYRRDPSELTNWAHVDRYAPVVNRMSSRLKAWCKPAPPFFVWP